MVYKFWSLGSLYLFLLEWALDCLLKNPFYTIRERETIGSKAEESLPVKASESYQMTGSTTFELVSETLLDYQALFELLDDNSEQVISYQVSLAQNSVPSH